MKTQMSHLRLLFYTILSNLCVWAMSLTKNEIILVIKRIEKSFVVW